MLDEVDYLTMKDQDVLYRMFEWAARPGSRLILIGTTSQLTQRPKKKSADPCDLRLLIAGCSQALPTHWTLPTDSCRACGPPTVRAHRAQRAS